MHKRLIVALTFLLFFPVTQANAIETGLLNSSAPNFVLTDIQRKKRTLAEWKNKLVILNFWATWCLPCREEIPLLNSLQKEFGTDELQVVGIAIDHWAAVKKYIAEIPINYVNLIGNIDATLLVKKYGNKTGALPYTVVIAPDGKIVSIATGQLTAEYLQRITAKYL